MLTHSLGTRPLHAEEEEGLVNLHTCKFEVRGISVGWIWLVDDCEITFVPTKAHVRVTTTWWIWLTDQRLIQESKHPSFNKLRYSPANLEQLESCYERDRSLQFHYPGSETVKVPLLRYVHWEFLAHGSHGGRHKSIILIVSPLEALMLDVAEAFMAMDTLLGTITSIFTVANWAHAYLHQSTPSIIA